MDHSPSNLGGGGGGGSSNVGSIGLGMPCRGGQQTFTDRNHPVEALNNLNEFRLAGGFLCDVKIEVEDKVFECHRSVLAATIPYFRSMFSSEMKESTQKVIQIQDIQPQAFEALLNFAYTATIDFTDSNVQSLLYAASILQMDSVCGACEEFLTNYLTLQNCLAIRNFAQQHNCTQLLHSVDKFSADNFQKLRNHNEFQQITYGHLKDLVGNDNLHVASEIDVYETVMAWITGDTESRKRHLPKLMSQIRLAQLPTNFLLEKVKNHPLVAADTGCHELIFQALQDHFERSHWIAGATPATANPANPAAPTAQIYSFSAKQTPSSSPLSTGKAQSNLFERSRPRKAAAGVVFCVGGRGTTGDPFRTVECYDWRKNRWFPVTEMGVKRRHVGVVSASGKLYAIGGHDGSEHLGSAEVFDPIANNWRPVSSMTTKRRGIAVGCLEGAIYAVGGLDDTTCFQTVERYDIEADRWSEVSGMNVQRGGVGVSALGKYLFAVGGNDGTSSLDSCERYDPHLDKWTLVAGMSHRRAGAGVTVLNGALYAIGGFDDNSPLSSCERYDPRTNEWTLLPKMSCPRGGVGVAAMGGRLYAVGGHDGVKYLDSVEALDPEKGVWEGVAEISHCRAGAGVSWCACTVDTLTSPLPTIMSGAGGVASCV